MQDALAPGSLSLLSAAALGTLAWLGPRARRRLELSRAKHRSLAGHSRIAKWLSARIPGYAYDEETFYASDGAPPAVVARRREGLRALGEEYAQRFARSVASTPSVTPAARTAPARSARLPMRPGLRKGRST